MANNDRPPPPPPHPQIRPPGQFPPGQRPQPPQGVRPPGSGGPHGPGPMHLPPKIIHSSSHVRDITPPKLLTEAECLQQLTTYAAFSIRKVPALSTREKPTWARAEVTEDRLDQADIKKQIRKLGARGGKNVAEKRAALANFQQGQVTALLDDLAARENDKNFEWSLVEMDRIEKEVPSSKPGKKAIETVVMVLYVRRAPLPGLNTIMMFQNIEKRRIDSLRPQPPPQQQQQQQPPPPPPQQIPRPPSAMRNNAQPAFVEINRGNSRPPNSRQRERRHHDRDDSSSGSSDSYDTASDSESDAGSSLGTSISRSTQSDHRRRRNSRAATRSHSRHRPKYVVEGRKHSPERRSSDAYGVPHHPQQHTQQHTQQHPHHPQQHQQGPPPNRPFVPDVPHNMVPAMDPITSAYQAGREDARAEIGDRIQSPQPVVIERIIERPVERPPIERIIEQPRFERIVESPRAVVSYTRLPERPRFAEPRYLEERFVDEVRSQDDDYLIRRREAEDIAILREREESRRREAEEYIDGRPLGGPDFGRRRTFSYRGPGSSSSVSPTGEFFDRMASDFDRRPSNAREFRRPEPRRVLTSPIQPHPFAQAFRRYSPSESSGNYTEPGW